jgi:hypothetical protein
MQNRFRIPAIAGRLFPTLTRTGLVFVLILFSGIRAWGGAIEDLENASGGHIDRPSSGGNRESDEERAERLRLWAEWRAEQKAEREAQRRTEAFNLNEQGNRAYLARDWKKAVELYKMARRLSPADPVIRQNLQNAEQALARANELAATAAQQQARREAEQRELSKKREQEARLAQEQRQQYERDLQRALARLKGERSELENEPAVWIERHGRLVQQRLTEPNKWNRALATSLTTKAPPLPYKKFSELQSGDVLLIAPARRDVAGTVINAGDAALSGTRVSDASHTVLYLKEVNGVRFFLDNVPGEGPRIVPEAYILQKYGRRQTEVARLAQPLNDAEGQKLYAAAREMRARNLSRIGGNRWFDGTTYGAWGKDDVVCAEADWSLLQAAGRPIPASTDRVKRKLGLDFSPADFYQNRQYFLVTPLELPR